MHALIMIALAYAAGCWWDGREARSERRRQERQLEERQEWERGELWLGI